MARKNMDEEFCGKVPLHQTNAIQPHGVLLVVAKDNLNILQVSENTETFLDIPANKLVNVSLPSTITTRTSTKE
ncbi:MAG: hypothetical protein C4329_07225 [Chitinophagaceae bacterium]